MVAPLQGTLQLFAEGPDLFLDIQEVFLADLRAVHLPAPLHQIMGLVDEKDKVLLPAALSEEPPQLHIGIKDIIIIADNGIHPGGQLQLQLIGADLPLFALGQDILR